MCGCRVRILHKTALVWAWFVMTATNWLPDMPVTMRIRGWLLSLLMVKCGRGFQVASGSIIRGLNFLSVGDDVYFGNGVVVLAGQRVEIEDEVMLGPYTVIADGNHTFEGRSYRFGKRKNGGIRIGCGSWIGAHCTVVSGVEVGAATLVGANSVVNRSLPGGVLAAGVPVKIIRRRDSAA